MERHSSTRTEAEMIAAILALPRIDPSHERRVYLIALSFMKSEADAEITHKRLS